MKRTTVMLPDELAQLVDRERRRRDVSAATVIREAVEAYLAPREAKPLPFIGIARGDGSAFGRQAEEILEREFADWIEESSGLNERRGRRGALGTTADASLSPSETADAGDR
jgi:hypothetical protein